MSEQNESISSERVFLLLSQAEPHKPVRHAVIMGYHVGTIRTLSKLFICQWERSWFHYQEFVMAAHFSVLELLGVEIKLTVFTLTELASEVSSLTTLKKYKTYSDRVTCGVKGNLTL